MGKVVDLLLFGAKGRVEEKLEDTETKLDWQAHQVRSFLAACSVLFRSDGSHDAHAAVELSVLLSRNKLPENKEALKE